eukprot:12270380-Alexandrium_andersonii.AAC.1
MVDAQTKVDTDCIVDVRSFLQEADRKRKQEATAKARQARQQNAEKKKKARTIDLNGLGSHALATSSMGEWACEPWGVGSRLCLT